LRTPHGNDYGRAYVRQWQASHQMADGVSAPSPAR